MPTDPQPVILVGASVRALAGSASRAGLAPHAIDLFGDLDLQALGPTRRLSGKYPEAFRDALASAPQAPWMYTGGLENYPLLVEEMALLRPLWGISGPTLRAVRCHHLLNQRLHRAGLAVPWMHRDLANPPAHGRWLLKPRRGSAGHGIRVCSPGRPPSPEEQRTCYLQEQIGGVPAAAVYLGDGLRTRLLGVTVQLIGTRYLGARGFHYAGSVGPLPTSPSLLSQLRYLGRVLGVRSKLRGIFGVDGIVRNHEFWPVEVNPRYTASVEVLEFALGQPLLAEHRRLFDRSAPAPAPFPPAGPCVGKAIVFAPCDLVMPAAGPWSESLASPVCVRTLPAFADIPAAGAAVAQGQPVLTAMASGADLDECLENLQRRAHGVIQALPRAAG